MALVPGGKKLPRLKVGNKVIDGWCDMVASTLERNSNVTGSGGIQAHVGPMGIHLALGGTMFRLAKTGGSGIAISTATTWSSGTVTLYDNTNGTITSQTITDKAFNPSTKGAIGNNAMVILFKMDNMWVVFWEDCG